MNNTTIVKIESISPRIEISHENNFFVIRAIILQNSYLKVGDYILQRTKDSDDKDEYLLSFLLVPPKKEVMKNIRSTFWSGVELRLPLNQLDSTINLFYFDKENKRKIEWGTKATWREYIDIYFKDSRMADSQRIEMLNNFDK